MQALTTHTDTSPADQPVQVLPFNATSTCDPAGPIKDDQPPQVLPLNAPVTVRELAEALDVTKQAVLKQTKLLPTVVPGSRVFALSSLEPEHRKRVLARRKSAAAAAARALTAVVPTAKQFPIHLTEFTEREQAEAAERREFILEVERLRLEHPTLPLDDICAKIENAACMAAHRHDGSLRYKALLIGGKLYASQLTARNYRHWKAVWDPWRSGPFDTSNWWALCDRRRFRQVSLPDGTIRFERRTQERFGDATFWALFEHFYLSPVRRSRKQSYELAVKAALKAGTPQKLLPSLEQVRSFYRFKADPIEVERARLGEKHYYDRLSYHVIRDWRNVKPNQCWSGDHHLFNFFIRWYDEQAGGWRPERPWLTDWIDVSSWYTVGWHISIQPSRDTIELALRDAVTRAKGVPQYAYFDNGKDYQAFSDGGRLGYDRGRAAGICAALGIRPIWALPGNPRAKLNESNYRILARFEQTFFSYCGMNKKHMDALWDTKREDGFSLRERLERFPKSLPRAGFLVRPELLPTIDEVRTAFARWLAEERHNMISKGRVCPGQSPAQRYLAVCEPPLLRRVTKEEIDLAFLRIHPRLLKVHRNGTLTWTPPGAKAAESLVFADDALREVAGERVQVRFDLRFFPPRLFVFLAHEHGDGPDSTVSWKLIRCSGPMGSVPNMLFTEPLVEDADASARLRDAIATARRLDRETRRGQNAEAVRQARETLAEQAGLPRAAGVYITDAGDRLGKPTLKTAAAKQPNVIVKRVPRQELAEF